MFKNWTPLIFSGVLLASAPLHASDLHNQEQDDDFTLYSFGQPISEAIQEASNYCFDQFSKWYWGNPKPLFLPLEADFIKKLPPYIASEDPKQLYIPSAEELNSAYNFSAICTTPIATIDMGTGNKVDCYAAQRFLDALKSAGYKPFRKIACFQHVEHEGAFFPIVEYSINDSEGLGFLEVLMVNTRSTGEPFLSRYNNLHLVERNGTLVRNPRVVDKIEGFESPVIPISIWKETEKFHIPSISISQSPRFIVTDRSKQVKCYWFLKSIGLPKEVAQHCMQLYRQSGALK